MIEGRFNIVFAGRLTPGKTEAEVKQNLARLFKTSVEQMERLFAGSEVTIKKNLEYAQAMKYQSALKQAGALVLIKKVETDDSPADQSPQSEVKPPLQPDQGAAPINAPSGNTVAPQDTVKAESPSESFDEDWSVADPGERLPEQEKHSPIAEPDLSSYSVGAPGEVLAESKPKPKTEVDTSGLSLDDLGPLPSAELPPVPEVDLSDLSVAPAGEKIPTAPDDKPKVNPDTSHLSLD